MERSESKDEKDQLCLSIIGQRKYFIKEYLNKVFDSIPVYISRDVGAMEILEIFLKESLINKHDLNLFAQEESYFYECMRMDSILFLQNWGRLCKALKNTYQVDDSFFFYFSSKLESGDSYAQEELLLWWKKQLTRKQLAYWIKLLDYYRKKFQKFVCTTIRQERSSFKDKNLWWSLGEGIWEKMDISIYEKYKLLFEHNDSLQNLADILGKRTIRKRDENRMGNKQEMTVTKTKADIIGIYEGNDLSSILCSEFALLHQGIDCLFYKKYASHQLEQWLYGYKESLTEKVGSVLLQEKKGPVIICLDTSGSMLGSPEIVAKAACYGIIYMALQERRKVFIITFSVKTKCLELTNWQKDISKIEDFLSHSFYGGTRIDFALQQTVELLNTQCYRQADVLLISDFVMPKLSVDIVTDIKKCQEQETIFHSLQIGGFDNHSILQLMNKKWKYNEDSGDIIFIK